MNKKGFTLVELLAVIAILAILVIIALPNVMGMFNSAKESTFVTEVQSIYKQVATDFVKDSLNSTGAQKYCQNVETANVVTTGVEPSGDNQNCKPLQLTTTKGYYVEVGNDGSVNKLVVYDGSFYYASPKKVEKATDIKSSTIKKADTLNSENKLNVSAGTPSTVGE